jgi:hypothetical protein
MKNTLATVLRGGEGHGDAAIQRILDRGFWRASSGSNRLVSPQPPNISSLAAWRAAKSIIQTPSIPAEQATRLLSSEE